MNYKDTNGGFTFLYFQHGDNTTDYDAYYVTFSAASTSYIRGYYSTSYSEFTVLVELVSSSEYYYWFFFVTGFT